MADYSNVGGYRHYSHFVGGATMSQCSNCSALAGVIRKQQAEIQKLRQALTEAQAVCVQITRESNQVMAQLIGNSKESKVIFHEKIKNPQYDSGF